MEGATGPSVTIQVHQCLPELHEQVNRAILSLEPRNLLAGCGAETRPQVCREANGKRSEGRQETEDPGILGTRKSLRVPVFAETQKSRWTHQMRAAAGSHECLSQSGRCLPDS